MGRENPLGYKTITFRQLCHAVQTSGRTRLLQPRVYEDYRKKKKRIGVELRGISALPEWQDVSGSRCNPLPCSGGTAAIRALSLQAECSSSLMLW